MILTVFNDFYVYLVNPAAISWLVSFDRHRGEFFYFVIILFHSFYSVLSTSLA